MHAFIRGVSWNVTLSDSICIRSVLRLSEEQLLLGPPVPTFLFACYLWGSKLNTITTVYSSSDQSTSSAEAQGPIYDFGSLSLQHTHTHTHTHTHIYIYYPCFSLFHISLPNSNLKQNNFIIFWENKTAPKFKINEIYIKKLLLISFKFKNKTKFLNKKLLTNGFFLI